MFRVVHIPPKYEVEQNKTYDPARADVPGSAPVGLDEQGPFWLRHDEVRKMVLLYCPDCGDELQAGNDPSVPFNFLVCPRGPIREVPFEVRPCHSGCLVACGVAAA